MKKILPLLAAMFLLSVPRAYGQNDVQFLNVTADHLPLSFDLADAPVITFVNDEMILTTAKQTVTNRLADVQKWTFSAVNVMVHDVNNDSRIDINDAFCIVNYVLRKPNPVFIREAADVNGDGTVDISDATRIINLIAGK